MDIKLRVWRQKDAESRGDWKVYDVPDIEETASFLEMLDILNDRLIVEGERPIAFDHDCREGICGSCSLTINRKPHGPEQVTSCQVYMRDFEEGEEIQVEPFRATAFPVVCDLVVDRSAFDRVTEAGGYISVTAGPKPEPNANPIAPEIQEEAMDAAICIGCGACVAACPNGSAMLYTGAKVTHLNVLPQGAPERYDRAAQMVDQMDAEGFGGCTNTGECEHVCPQNISIEVIGELNRDYRKGMIHRLRARRGRMEAQ